jgi:hypothetical protein
LGYNTITGNQNNTIQIIGHLDCVDSNANIQSAIFGAGGKNLQTFLGLDSNLLIISAPKKSALFVRTPNE